jgi:hypothetical protein
MALATFRDRYPPPWHVEDIPGGYKVMSANGFAIAYVYALEGHARSASPNALTVPEARALAHAIAGLPEQD